jgi:dTDP-glucose 4,6-dehydratase
MCIFPPLPEEDLDSIVEQLYLFWPKLAGKNIFISGGTGFFGHWLVESFLKANIKYALKSKVFILTRNKKAFEDKNPHLNCNSSVTLIEGDIKSFKFPSYQFEYIIHAATDTYSKPHTETSDSLVSSIKEGTKHILDLAIDCKASHFLFVSSGAVYGPQPKGLLRLSENDFVENLENNITLNEYSTGKRAAELVCSEYAKKSLLKIKIARCFAFVGPHLPLDKHFAIGNFIRDSISNKTIRILGDGTPERSYLYASDLAIWLWKILDLGMPLRPYNVGSDHVVNIRETAHLVAQTLKNPNNVEIASKPIPNQEPLRYVPSVERANLELNLKVTIPLDLAIKKTANWHRLGQ